MNIPPSARFVAVTSRHLPLDYENRLLRDALDHVARIANASRTKTKRLDWIACRAQLALKGQPWDRNFMPEPNKQSLLEVHELRNTMFMLVQAIESDSVAAISAAAGEARYRHPSLFRKPTSSN